MNRTRIALAALTLLLVSACSKVTPDNYEKLESGTTQDEVHQILGKPDDVSGGGIGKLTVSTETWNGPKHTITATFTGEKLSIKHIEPREK